MTRYSTTDPNWSKTTTMNQATYQPTSPVPTDPRPDDPKSIYAILEDTASLIEQGHCKGTLARDEQGQSVNHLGRLAVTYCLAGAVGQATHRRYPFPSYAYSQACEQSLQAIREVIEGKPDADISLASWQDQPEIDTERVLSVTRAAAKRQLTIR